MRDDVVERSEVRRNGAKVELVDANVVEAKLAHHLPRPRDRRRREIETDERRIGQRRGNRYQVRAVAAGELEDTRRRDRRDVEAKQRSKRRQPIRMPRRIR